MNNFFYQFNENSELGKKLKAFHNECLKADKAAENYAVKMGASAYYSSSYAFAGGVACLEFDSKKVDKKTWRLIEERDGHCYYEPACNTIDDCIVCQPGFTPSDTSTRIYEKTTSTWNEVSQLHTLREWAQIANYTPTGDKEKDTQQLNVLMGDKRFIKFIQFTGLQEPKKGHKNARSLLRAVKAERMRMKLPVVPVHQLYKLLQADDNTTDDKELSTPTFFLFRGTYFIAIDRECKHPDIQLSTKQMYIFQSNLLQRQIQRMKTQIPS